MTTLLALDLSTNSTGFALFNMTNNKLLHYGFLKPQVPGLHKLKYPKAALHKMKDLSAKVRDLIAEHNPDYIVIEEINRGISRLSQKGLDGYHFVLLEYLLILGDEVLDKISYIDSNGPNGWRGELGLKLSAEDKAKNKEIRKLNKKNKLKYSPIDWKILACRWVNARYKKEFDVEANTHDSDICDAICIGAAWLSKKSK